MGSNLANSLFADDGEPGGAVLHLLRRCALRVVSVLLIFMSLCRECSQHVVVGEVSEALIYFLLTMFCFAF